MDFVSKIVSGNIDRIKRNISNSFVQDLDVEKGFDDELEKGKWNVGDQRFYHGTMHYVAELKPDGSPRWKRVKKNSGGGDDTSSSTKTSDDSKNSEDVKSKISNLKNEIEKLRKRHLELDSEYREAESKSKRGNKYTAGWNLSNLDKIKHDYEENKELLKKKKDILKKLENSINNDDSQQSTKNNDSSDSKQKDDSSTKYEKKSVFDKKVNISKIPDKEYGRITTMLEKQKPDERYIDSEEMSDKELMNFKSVADSFVYSSKISSAARARCREWSYLASKEIKKRRQK